MFIIAGGIDCVCFAGEARRVNGVAVDCNLTAVLRITAAGYTVRVTVRLYRNIQLAGLIRLSVKNKVSCILGRTVNVIGVLVIKPDTVIFRLNIERSAVTEYYFYVFFKAESIGEINVIINEECVADTA